MRITIATRVKADYRTVWAGFDARLFIALKPPLIALRLDRFDGCLPQHQVHLRIGRGIFAQRWTALITEQAESDTEIYFIDQGLQLPAPLREWQHRHRIVKHGNHALIIDDIEYHTGAAWLNMLIYLPLWVQFWLRKPVYRRFFGKI